MRAPPTTPPARHTQPLYARIARHYRGAIPSGALSAGAAMPSVRALKRLHPVSLSTALQACRRLDAAQYVGIHDRVSHCVAMSERHPARVDFAATYAAPGHHPHSDLKNAAGRSVPACGCRPEDIVVTHGCIEALNVAPGSLFSNSSRFDHPMRVSCGTPFTGEADQALKQLASIVRAAG